MMEGEISESGYKARAGALTLLFLSSPMERHVLLTLLAEATTGVKLQEIDPPEEDVLHMHIFADPYMFEPADPNHPPGAPIDEHTMLQPTPAGREVPFVGAVLADWLARCPTGPLAHDVESAPEISALLCGWVTMVTHALAGGPLTPEQVCEAIQIADIDSVDARLDSMEDTYLIEEAPAEDPEEEPRLQATEWLRRSVAPLAAAARMELRHPPGDTAPISALDVGAAFRLALPLLELPTELSGSCSLAVELDEGVAGSPAGVTARIESGRVISCEAGLDEDADAWASATTGDWLDTVIEPDAKFVRTGGDRKLPSIMLRELHKTLFADVEPLQFR
jgi:hypothetical protein